MTSKRALRSGDEEAEERTSGAPATKYPTEGALIRNQRDAYKVVRKLGEGAFGTCWLATGSDGRKKGERVVLKVSHTIDYAYDALRREIKIYDRIDMQSHENRQYREHIVRMLDCFNKSILDQRYSVLVLEEGTSNVLRLVKRYYKKGLPLEHLRKVLEGTVKGLVYLHEHCNVIHGDLKSENLVLRMRNGQRRSAMLSASGESANASTTRSNTKMSAKRRRESETSDCSDVTMDVDLDWSSVMIIDMSNAFMIGSSDAKVLTSGEFQPRSFRAAEVVLGGKITPVSCVRTVEPQLRHALTSEDLTERERASLFTADRSGLICVCLRLSTAGVWDAAPLNCRAMLSSSLISKLFLAVYKTSTIWVRSCD